MRHIDRHLQISRFAICPFGGLFLICETKFKLEHCLRAKGEKTF